MVLEYEAGRCETEADLLRLAKARPDHVAVILTTSKSSLCGFPTDLRPFVTEAGFDVNLVSDAWPSDGGGMTTLLNSCLEFRETAIVAQLLALGADPYRVPHQDPLLILLTGHNCYAYNSPRGVDACEATLRVLAPHLTHPCVLDQSVLDDICELYVALSPYLRDFLASCEIEGRDSPQHVAFLRARAEKFEAERQFALVAAGKSVASEEVGRALAARQGNAEDAALVMQGVMRAFYLADVGRFLAEARVPVDYVTHAWDNVGEEATTLLLAALEARDEGLVAALLVLGADPFALDPRANPLEIALCGTGYGVHHRTAECEAVVRLLEPVLPPTRRVVRAWVLDEACEVFVRESDYLRAFLAGCAPTTDEAAADPTGGYGACKLSKFT